MPKTVRQWEEMMWTNTFFCESARLNTSRFVLPMDRRPKISSASVQWFETHRMFTAVDLVVRLRWVRSIR